MLGSQLGIRLLLLTADAGLPRPAGTAVMQAVQRVEVVTQSAAGAGDGFQIVFSMPRRRAPLAPGFDPHQVAPGTRVIIGVVLGVMPVPLIDGIVTEHEWQQGEEARGAMLSVTGQGLAVALKFEERNRSYPNQTDDQIVTQILRSTRYSQYGLFPETTPTSHAPSATDRVPKQAETDYDYIQRLAKQNGFTFFIEPVSIGLNRAFFGPEPRTGARQRPLALDCGPSSNLRSLTFSLDGLAPEAVEALFRIPGTSVVLPIPAMPIPRLPPLAAQPAPALRSRQLRSGGRSDGGEALRQVRARMVNSKQALRGEGELDTVRYGHVLRARRLVDVRGAGPAFNGTYTVERVKHVLERGTYSQSFGIVREGTGSLIPVVTG